tara:strand:+ start:1726 stop:2529 length:804 start_codon:yes stop_codon:yes gene_type:complete
MSELQNDEGAVTEAPEVEDHIVIDGADLATASDEQHEPIAQVDEEAAKSKAIQDRFDKQTFKTKQAERDLQSANDKLKALEDKESQRKEAQFANLPEFPSEYDDNFEQKKADYFTAYDAQKDHEHEVAATKRDTATQQQQVQQQQLEQLHSTQTAYDARSTELGISPEELGAAGAAVMKYGLSNELTMHILSDKDGPLITKHLAANPQEGFEIASMSPYAVGAYLDTVRVKAQASMPKPSNAPDPAPMLNGNGVAPKDIGPAGATYE